MFITAYNEREKSPVSIRYIRLTVFLSITVVTCYQIQPIMDYRRRLIKLSFYLVDSGEGSPQKKNEILLLKLRILVYSE